MATDGPTAQTDQFTSGGTVTNSSTSGAVSDQGNPSLGKDEVAWFFVEQYYTTLSKTPEKLHLFYGKRSQYVYGQEGQSAKVDIGRQNIQERIKALDFQNCKVRVTNVDSQASFDNIVIQVIGETSNKAGDPKKFVQTFVLAQQPSGYFVLNDIFRYIEEEGEEEATEQVEEATADGEAETSVPVAAPEQVEESEPVQELPAETQPASIDPEIVVKKLEEASATPEVAASINGGDNVEETPAEEPTEAPEANTEAADEPVTDPEIAAQQVAEETVQEPEKPKDPTPTPAASRQPSTTAPAPTPARPSKPMTWASRIAAAAGPTKVSPVTPLPKAAPVPAAVPATARPAAAAATPIPTASQTTPAATPAAESSAPTAPAKEAGTEWQTAGGDSKRQNRPQSISGPPTEKEGTLGYVKYVTDKVNREELEAALAQYGELAYFDINRQKNCAFVEFKTIAGYQAAAAANPHVVNGESIVVEARRPKAGAYGGSNYNAGRGGPHRGGRGGFDAGRSGNHGSRGSFGGQNRGRGGPTRGRGGSGAPGVPGASGAPGASQAVNV